MATKFANDNSVVAVIGHVCSSATLAAMPIYIRKGLACISPTSTNATIGKTSKGWFFRNCYTDDFQSTFLADYVHKVLGYKTVGIFFEQNDYAIGLKDAFGAQAKKLGIKVVGGALPRQAHRFGPLSPSSRPRARGHLPLGYPSRGLIAQPAARPASRAPSSARRLDRRRLPSGRRRRRRP